MNKGLFSPDIFSDSIPKFKKSNNAISKFIKNIISENYTQISNDIISIEQFQGNEINSNNYKITTSSHRYLIKKFINVYDIDKLTKTLELNNWLNNSNIHSAKTYLSNSSKFLVKDKSDYCYWAIFDFIDGVFFSGGDDHELKSVASEIGLLFKNLEKTPPGLYPSEEIRHFKDSENLIEAMQNSRENWTNYFGEDLSLELKESWEFIKNSYSRVLKSKERLLYAKKTPSHIDLHPHNILTHNNKIKSILDMDSIKLEFNLVSLSFSMYKLLRNSIAIRGIGANTKEISRISRMYFTSLSKEFPSIKKENKNLFTYASAEIFRRIFIIFSLNLHNNDSRWNHVLLTHLNGLKEAEIIFDSFKSNISDVIPKNILIRVDSSSTIGTGHIMRDLVLAYKYKASNVIFATQDLDGNINYKIKEAGYTLEILKSNSLKEVTELVKKHSIDLVVIDHYGIDYKYEKKLKKRTGAQILSVDDTYEKHYCDILLNHNIYANEKKYKKLVPENCELRCGSKYTLLRDEFIEEKKKKPKIKRNKVKTVFVAMGGSDHSNISIKILKVLEKFDNLKVNLVTTTANKNLEELKKYVKNRAWIKLHINSEKIAKLMRKSDFAIVTPSVTLNEVYFMEVPFIAIKTADNQEEMFSYLKKKNFLVLKKYETKKLYKYLHILFDEVYKR